MFRMQKIYQSKFIMLEYDAMALSDSEWSKT